MMRRIVIAAITGAVVLAPSSALALWNAVVTPGTTTASAASQVLAPASATATAVSSTAVNVTATAPSSGSVIPTAYRVQRAGATVTGCASLAFNQTCADTGLSAGTAYTYTVYGRVGSQWVSTASVQAQATTQAAPHWSSTTAGATSISTGQAASWTVVFSKPVSGVTAANFQLTNVSGSAAASIASVKASGPTPATTWTLTSGSVTGAGSVRLDLKSKTGIVDADGTGLTDTTFPESGGAAAVVTVASPAAVDITDVTRSYYGNAYGFSGTASGGGTITVTVYSNYNTKACTPTGNSNSSSSSASYGYGGGWSTNSGFALGSRTTYYVKAVMANPSASSPVYAVTIPSSPYQSPTLSDTGC